MTQYSNSKIVSLSKGNIIRTKTNDCLYYLYGQDFDLYDEWHKFSWCDKEKIKTANGDLFVFLSHIMIPDTAYGHIKLFSMNLNSHVLLPSINIEYFKKHFKVIV